MSYTLRGRLESRLATSILPFLAACVLAAAVEAWWPLQLLGVMIGVGLLLDLVVYDRLLPYQPGWAALPLGLLELAATMGLARVLSVGAPLGPALWLFAGAWLAAQVVGHAGLPVLRLSYAEDGGELGEAGSGLFLAAPVAALVVLGTAAVTQPPTVVLEAGMHRGPLVLDHAQTLVGEPGAVVKGGIVVTADDVTIRRVTVLGGENGIDVEWAENVRIEDVTVMGAKLDGIHARRSSVAIHDCRIHSPPGYTQGIDISFGMDLGMSMVEDCTVTGGQEGIVTHSVMAEIRSNHVSGTSMRGISMTEMSMGGVERNHVSDAIGVGVYCGDRSECEIKRNTIVGIRPDRASGDLARAGIGIEAFFESEAHLEENQVAQSPRATATFARGTIEHER